MIRTYCAAAELAADRDRARRPRSGDRGRRPRGPRAGSRRTAAVLFDNPRSSAASRPSRGGDRGARARPRRRDDRRRRPALARHPRAARRPMEPTSSSAAPSLSASTCRAAAAPAASSPRATSRVTPTSTRPSCSASPRRSAGEMGFGLALFEQTSYGSREEGNDWTGNSVYLWVGRERRLHGPAGPGGVRVSSAG